MGISKNMILAFFAIMGTIISFSIVNVFIIPITIGKYITIEVVISILHYLYNKAKML